MSTLPIRKPALGNGYPTSVPDMPESEWHRSLMLWLIDSLTWYYRDVERVCVSGNLLIFYSRGDRRRHVSPDVFVVRGVEKRVRPNYLVWEEGQAPEFVIELTSSSTHTEDTGRKFRLYRDTLRVREYFLFDPDGDFLSPRLCGYRLRAGVYHSIRPRAGRLPSQVTGLHLEANGRELRLWDPTTVAWLPTFPEREAAAEAARDAALAERDAATARVRVLEAELARLRRDAAP
jgi:Uma2 family endonuclease